MADDGDGDRAGRLEGGGGLGHDGLGFRGQIRLVEVEEDDERLGGHRRRRRRGLRRDDRGFIEVILHADLRRVGGVVVREAEFRVPVIGDEVVVADEEADIVVDHGFEFGDALIGEDEITAIAHAAIKRPISDPQMDLLVDDIAHEIETEYEREVPSTVIGRKVMDKLEKVDEVAFLRFASVYRRFRDASQFLSEIENLIGRQ